MAYPTTTKNSNLKRHTRGKGHMGHYVSDGDLVRMCGGEPRNRAERRAAARVSRKVVR